ncbi:hypothetical protein H8356DRAFT_1431729 [Neocallimastix lanati (nom. inval.)]|nr:hypothetical protein H8356DRAFT_1431729 [Neocallimastix sp. JGI-2020a]
MNDICEVTVYEVQSIQCTNTGCFVLMTTGVVSDDEQAWKSKEKNYNNKNNNTNNNNNNSNNNNNNNSTYLQGYRVTFAE